MRAIAALLLFLVGTAGAGAAAVSPWASLGDPVFMRVDSRELAESVVEAIAQDSTGFLWIGTQGGLARYDGYHFKNYLPKPGDPSALPDGYIRSLRWAPSGLWIGSDSSGLVRFDAATETFHTWRADPRGKRGPRSATIYWLEAAPHGGLWIGGDAGLDYFDTRAGTFAPFALGSGKNRGGPARRILVDRSGTVWVASDNGLFRRSATGTHFTKLAFAPASGGPLRVRGLYEDREGNLWVGGDDVLYELDRNRRVHAVFHASTDDATTILPGPEFSIIEPAPGTIWAGSNDGGISIIDATTGRVRRDRAAPEDSYGLTAGRIAQFLRDRSGLIWLANYSGGLLLYNPLGHGAYVLSRGRLGMGDTGATAIAVLDRRLWVGGSHGTLIGLEPNAPEVRLNVPNGSTVAGLDSSSDGKLWIGTIEGLCALDPGRSAAQCPSGPSQIENQTIVWLVVETPDAYWIGTGDGLFVQDKRSGAVTTYRHGSGPNAITSDLIGAVYADRNGRYVWVGTANGLNRIDPRTHRVTRYTFDPSNPNSFGPGSVEWIMQDRTGRLWIGMNGGPLNVLERPDGTIRFLRLGRSNGLPHENVDGLAQDAQGQIWASTDTGLALIDPVTLRARAFGRADGVLPSNYWGGSVAQAADGTIFFGSEDGVSVIAPGATSPWTYAPPVVLTSLKVGERSLPLANGVTLQPGERDVTAEFAALDYSDPAAVQYEYRLEGFDRDWIHTDTLHRIATYTNLAPAHYVLHVRGTNRLGVWSPHDLTVSIDVLPAWYETWWLRLLAIVAAVLAVLGILQLRTASLRRHAQELEAMVRDRTHALEEASLSDPLTGLRNRRFVVQTAGHDATLALRQKTDLVFFMIDIDLFKEVNDAFGHHAGDSVLVQMRERLQRVFRESDSLVRWGGEEFLVVARASSRADAPEIAERIRAEIADHPFTLDGGRTITKTASIGFAAFPFWPAEPHAVSWEQVVDLADRALYLAKQSGRNTWRGLAAGISPGRERVIAPEAVPAGNG
jgi:diguanylate cyclase (GGDEF)-like protein